MNSRTYSEVYQLLQYLPENEYIRIPKEKIKYLEQNMDKNMEKICTITTKIDQIELSSEAKIIFMSLFYNYIANDDQKIKLKNFIENKEKEVLDSTYNKMFTNTRDSKEKVEENTALMLIPKETIFTKIKKIVLKLKEILNK